MTERSILMPDGHPVNSYLAESILIRQLIENMNSLKPQNDFQKFYNLFNQLATIEKRFARKENQLFPFLEKNGWNGPSKNMWSFHDTMREMIRLIRKNIKDNDIIAMETNTQYLTSAISRLLHIEENILFPSALDLLSETEWEIMRHGEAEIGWMLQITPAMPTDVSTNSTIDNINASNGKQHYDEGFMTLEQVNLIFRTMPLDITFVDENDRVIFYNRGEERVFPRSTGIIGREVKFCHPPKSVDTVLKILEAFRSGEKSEASFWINHKERLIYIRYFAVRDNHKNYKGVIEISQDITEIKAIEGERRLLEWS